MNLIEFEDLPDTSTPVNAANLNNNFSVLNTEFENLNDELTEKILTETFSLNNIALNPNSILYQSFTIPSKTGYTPIEISEQGIYGPSSGYVITTANLNGDIRLYNPTNSSINNLTIYFKIIYLKNS